jgi:hypothetical protein
MKSFASNGLSIETKCSGLETSPTAINTDKGKFSHEVFLSGDASVSDWPLLFKDKRQIISAEGLDNAEKTIHLAVRAGREVDLLDASRCATVTDG